MNCIDINDYFEIFLWPFSTFSWFSGKDINLWNKGTNLTLLPHLNCFLLSFFFFWKQNNSNKRQKTFYPISWVAYNESFMMSFYSHNECYRWLVILSKLKARYLNWTHFMKYICMDNKKYLLRSLGGMIHLHYFLYFF